MNTHPFTDSAGNAGSLRAIVDMFAELGDRLRSTHESSAFETITHVAVERVRGTEAASMTVLRNGKSTTVASTDDRALQADKIQYELGSGPCVDAILDNSLYRPEDLRHDERWPEYGSRVHKELGWTSMLSYRLGTGLTAGGLIAGLNLYSQRVSGFDSESADVGLLLATHGALAVAAELNHERAQNLERALATNREIGVAIGVLMTRHNLTREQAFDALRIASQNTNRKLADLAVEVGDTGELCFGGR